MQVGWEDENVPKGLKIANVENGSIGEELELVPGDKIIAVDGREIEDIIDFQYLTADEEFILLIEKMDGELWELEIEQSADEYLGLSFEQVSAGGLKLCQNNCVFCFVAQMPEGLRPSLYDKDDDYRLSMTQGSFITLSNLSEEEIDRIIDFHLSPLYISVHAWEKEARIRLMKNPHAGNLAIQLKRLADAGITLHTQIVLVPGYNDGEVLAETVKNLTHLYPAVQSVGVVPVGLTKFRTHLPLLKCFTRGDANSLLTWGHTIQKKNKHALGTNLVYFSDEFYILAGHEFPSLESYEELFQLENGIGMASKFRAEIMELWDELPEKIQERHIHIITGVSAYDFFNFWKEALEKQIKGLKITLHRIVNHFFGATVTVAGLLTAEDISAQVGELNGDYFLVPKVMLKADEDIFLDDKRIEWLEQKIKGKALIVENDGRAFLESLLGYNWKKYK